MGKKILHKLDETNREKALSFLRLEPSYNVFTIGDIENFGFHNDFQDVWADRDTEGNIHVLILRYYTNFVVYAHDDQVDFGNTVALLSKNKENWMLSGKRAIVCEISRRLGISDTDIENQNIAELKPANFKFDYKSPVNVEWATDDNFDEVIKLQSEIDEFRYIGDSTDAIVFNQKSRTGRTTLVRQNGIVVSSASSAAENSSSAMIIGVCTRKGYRNSGFASACMHALCAELLLQKKTVCLFYNNPLAAGIYKKMGFRDVGYWAFVNKNAGPIDNAGPTNIAEPRPS